MFPVAYWLQNELHPFVEPFLLDSHFVREGLFQQSAISRLIEDHRNGRVDNHVRLWMLLNLAIWHRIYVERLGQEAVAQSMTASLGATEEGTHSSTRQEC
jgi:asparagine synthase (glutamine-hydrolysing)